LAIAALAIAVSTMMIISADKDLFAAANITRAKESHMLASSRVPMNGESST